MIKKLKKKFIALSMISLTLLLTVIVAGMNIINYSKVVSDADARLDVLEQNPIVFQDASRHSGHPDRLLGRGGRGGRSMTRDEAEELTEDCSGEVRSGRVVSVEINVFSDWAEEVRWGIESSGCCVFKPLQAVMVRSREDNNKISAFFFMF